MSNRLEDIPATWFSTTQKVSLSSTTESPNSEIVTVCVSPALPLKLTLSIFDV